MATPAVAEKFRIKLTIAPDESPELYQLLRGIADCQQRTRRFKDLASKGLFAERIAGGLMQGLAATAHPMSAKPPVAPMAGETVGSLLDWGGEGAR
jgi:hypothetical protein